YDDIAEELLSLLEGDELYKWEQDVFYYYNELYEDDITTYLENTDPIFLEDIPYIFVAPKAWKAMDLSKVVNIALLQKNQIEDLAIGLEVKKENIVTDPLVGEVGLIVMDKVENVNNLEDAAEILKAYDLDKLGPYSINDEDFSLDDEEHWGLWIQFDDGTVKEYKNSGQEGEVTVPEDFNSLAKELESFVQRKLKED
ncbi:MAG TPA: hypothetical protein VK093_00085, partial [Candidatus Avipropionibacterium sp.]|nr:hypothetical protein [Candidatus Avipropionibacterium sp.]